VRTQYEEEERRSKLRIPGPFPAVVRGVDRKGQAFETDTVLDNLSAGGLYFRLIPRVEEGAKVFVVVQLSMAPTEEATRSRLGVLGVTLRVEAHPSGAWGTAVAFTRHRFF
jgi:hypothetical protein